MARHFFFLLSLVAIALGVSGCQDGDPGVKRFAFISNGVAEFWKIAEAGAKQAGEDFGIEVEVLMPGSLSDQKQMMEDAITRGMDGVAVSPIDSANQTDMFPPALAPDMATRSGSIPQDSE